MNSQNHHVTRDNHNRDPTLRAQTCISTQTIQIESVCAHIRQPLGLGRRRLI